MSSRDVLCFQGKNIALFKSTNQFTLSNYNSFYEILGRMQMKHMNEKYRILLKLQLHFTHVCTHKRIYAYIAPHTYIKHI